jgi:hypothetical protein
MQRAQFKAGTLWQRWLRDYPELFDADDARLVGSQAPYNYHFYEWLAAVLLYNLTGYLSLVEKYQFKNHLVKGSKLERLLPPQYIQTIYEFNRKGAQFPDLLVYRQDFGDWFFCEVKGPKDYVRDSQNLMFHQIEAIFQKEVRVIQFKCAKS